MPKPKNPAPPPHPHWSAAVRLGGITDVERGRALGIHNVTAGRWAGTRIPGPIVTVMHNPILCLALAMDAEERLRQAGMNPNLLRERIALAARAAELDAALEQGG